MSFGPVRHSRDRTAVTAPQSGAVLTVGEALVGYASVADNLRTATDFTRFPGGADLNVAVRLTRLGIPATWAASWATTPMVTIWPTRLVTSVSPL